MLAIQSNNETLLIHCTRGTLAAWWGLNSKSLNVFTAENGWQCQSVREREEVCKLMGEEGDGWLAKRKSGKMVLSPGLG